MSYHELHLELRKSFKIFLYQHSAFLHPHSAPFDQSWENHLLTSQISSQSKTQEDIESIQDKISNDISYTQFGHWEVSKPWPARKDIFSSLELRIGQIFPVLEFSLFVTWFLSFTSLFGVLNDVIDKYECNYDEDYFTMGRFISLSQMNQVPLF